MGAFFNPDPITGQTYQPVNNPAPPGTTPPPSISGLSTQQMNDYRPFPMYSHIYVGQHNINASYNSLQVLWNKQMGHLLYGVNYTFSKALGILGANGNGTPPIRSTTAMTTDRLPLTARISSTRRTPTSV